jgi:transcriptional regulator with XRE-family HTH domain
MSTVHVSPQLWGLFEQHTETSPSEAWTTMMPSRMAVLAASALTASCLFVVADLAAPVAFYAHEATSDREQAASGLAHTEPFVSPASTARSIRDTKQRSGLTWDQLASIFGVSRRAIHGWASGARMNAQNAEALALLRETLAAIEVPGDPGSTRTALLQSAYVSHRPGSTAVPVGASIGASSCRWQAPPCRIGSDRRSQLPRRNDRAARAAGLGAA